MGKSLNNAIKIIEIIMCTVNLFEKKCEKEISNHAVKTTRMKLTVALELG